MTSGCAQAWVVGPSRSAPIGDLIAHLAVAILSMDGVVTDPVLEDLQKFLADHFERMGELYEIAEVTDRGVALRLPIDASHERPGGTVSGPTMMGLADGAAWMATLSRIGPVALAVTSSLTINFLSKPALAGELWAYADLLRLGRRLSVCDVRFIHTVPGGDAQLVAQATVTYAIPT